MAIPFPPSPKPFQTYTYDGATYSWVNEEWIIISTKFTQNYNYAFNQIQIDKINQFNSYSHRNLNFQGINVSIFSADSNTLVFSASSSSTSSSTFTGGTVSGATNFTNGLTANIISATTYQNLPSSTFSGGTVSGATNFTNGLTATTISATTYQGLPLTNKGDIFTFSTVNTRLSIGADGTILMADSATTTGNKWVALSGDVTINTSGATTIKSSVALAGNPTTTTQSATTNNTTIATTEFVNSAASNDQFILASQIFS